MFQVERKTEYLSRDTTSYESVFGITSLTKDKADLHRLLTLNRGHWSIENKSHYVRDVVFDEDRCRFRTGNGGRVFATLRNLVIGILRLAKVKNISSGIRECMWNPRLIMRLMGIETTASVRH